MVESSTPMIEPQLTDAATSHLLTGGEDVGFTEGFGGPIVQSL
jgi:hypothetical protein